MSLLIYTEIEIINNGLQDINFGAKKYDLIIGNPPYSDEKMTDDYMPDLNGYTIHHYFTAKCMRLLSDNGILAFVLPSFYMDIPRSNTRHIINGESVVIDVIRLPENLFEQATVTVDILLLRKTGNKIHDITKTVTYTQGEANDQVNEFWVKNPNRILGNLKLKWVKAYNRFVPTCEVEDKEKTLHYLENCTFDDSTIENYQEIIRSSENTVINHDISLLKVISDELSGVFIEIEQLENITRNANSRLAELHNKTWQLLAKINSLIDNS